MSHELNPSACLQHIMQLIKEGKLRDAIRTSPQCMIACVMVIIAGVIHSTGKDTDPPITFGSPEAESAFREQCRDCCDQLGLTPESVTVTGTEAEPTYDSIAGMLIAKLLELLLEALLKK